MNHLAKQTINNDSDEIPKNEQVWHLIRPEDMAGDPAILCTGEFIDDGECQLKTTKRGGITCPKCLQIIRSFKAVRL